MTLVNTHTGELVESLTADEARRLTEKIRLLGGSLADTLDRMAELIDQARTGSAWLALGYRSWTEYVAEEFADVLPRLDREPRQEFVRGLNGRGMSSRAIAPVVGVDHSTVVRDLSRGADAPPETPEGGAPGLHPLPRPPVTGIDGKTYTVPPRREPTPEEVERAEVEHGWRTTNVNIAEAVRSIAAQAPGDLFVREFLPRHDQYVVDGMRLTAERCEDAITFLQAVVKEINR